MRTYNKIKFFAHAEENNVAYPLADNDLSMFIRLGTDYNLNYYEYEIPLKVTPWGASARDEVWPEENQVEIDFDILKAAKAARNTEIRSGNVNVSFTEPYLLPAGEEYELQLWVTPIWEMFVPLC